MAAHYPPRRSIASGAILLTLPWIVTVPFGSVVTSSIFFQFDHHLAIAMNEASRDNLGRFDHIHAQAPLLKFCDQCGQLELGNARADAAVDAIAERQVPPGILALDPDQLAILKDALVAVGRGVPQGNPVVLFDLLPEQFGVFGRGPAHVRKRCLPTDDLMHRIHCQFRRMVLLKDRALVGMLVQPPGRCQSDAKLSLSVKRPLTRAAPQSMRFCHSARAAERQSL